MLVRLTLLSVASLVVSLYQCTIYSAAAFDNHGSGAPVYLETDFTDDQLIASSRICALVSTLIGILRGYRARMTRIYVWSHVSQLIAYVRFCQ